MSILEVLRNFPILTRNTYLPTYLPTDNVKRIGSSFAAGRYGSVSVAKITSMGLIVAEKSFKNATNHRMEATIGMMSSGHKNFPVLFGETKNSLIMEFVGDPHTLRPTDTIHSILKQKQRQLDWANITRQIVSAFAALHSKEIMHCEKAEKKQVRATSGTRTVEVERRAAGRKVDPSQGR